MLRTLRWAPVAVLAALVGCTDPSKMPADAAIKAGEAAIEGIRAEATKYVPSEFKALSDALAKAKDQYAKGEFKAALESAKDLAQKAKDLGAAAVARKDELIKAWGEASASLPKMIEVIKSRTDILSQAKKLPAGMDAGKLQAAKDGLAGLTRSLDDATAKFKAGSLQEAVAAAKPLKAKASEIMGMLGMQVAGSTSN
jgi:soluble cytochrome b562